MVRVEVEEGQNKRWTAELADQDPSFSKQGSIGAAGKIGLSS